ncbi:methyl-accepting chemotaxis protein [Pseudoalteromonas shioyasakiensis]|uniref:methyl-accepting chemotaxis protein n=1 Tax=Pseudoalteromonas shioyasakiensis TaxID=1190813 RepID=UPI001EFE9D74|nr:methyl-accepting chemotaxis protein [Pseudoalteromonas shioyasakiensis]MCG9733981.1 methyl-accepting chemotaxis protein [Pseudoalteromonas shioyasakiensis]
MQLLRKISFQQALAAVIAFALVVMFAASYTVINESLVRKSTVEKDAVYIREALMIDEIAHETAVERGLTAGLIGSGYSQNKERVAQQRVVVDKEFDKFARYTQQHKVSSTLFNAVLAKHKKITELRESVDKKQGKQAFVVYSDSNKFMLDVANRRVSQVKQSEAIASGLAIVEMSLLKERLGQVRGKVNGVLSSKSISESNQVLVSSYFHNIEETLFLLSLTLTGDADKKWLAELTNSQTYQDVKSIVEKLNQESGELSLSYPTPADWFAQSTELIGKVRKHILNKQQALESLIEQSRSSANTTVYVTSGFAIILIGLFFAFGLFVIKSLARKVTRVRDVISTIATSHDLAVRINDNSSDEIGAISRSVDELVDALTDLIRQVQQANNTSESSVRSLITFAKELSERVENINSTTATLHDNFTRLYSQIEQIAVSAEESSKNTIKANDLSASTKQIIGRNKASISSLSELIQQAHEQSDALSAKTSSIQSVLDTISSIAEQTNLLALNAAIEAARAGEQGRGFAVVADEVRGLATRSQDSTSEISSVLDDIKQQVQQLQVYMENTSDSTQMVSDNSEQALSNIDTLTANIADVSSQTNTVSDAIESQSQLAEEASKASENITSNMHDVQNELALLEKLITDLENAQQKTSDALNVFKVD